MDRLVDLKPNLKFRKTPQETEIINNLFPNGVVEEEDEKGEGEASSSSGTSKGVNWRATGAVIIAFILLANPWIDNFFKGFSFVGVNQTMIFGCKTVIFALLVLIIAFFMR